MKDCFSAPYVVQPRKRVGRYAGTEPIVLMWEVIDAPQRRGNPMGKNLLGSVPGKYNVTNHATFATRLAISFGPYLEIEIRLTSANY